MPFYRILVWTHRREQPYMGIRSLPESETEVVYADLLHRSINFYKAAFKHIEVQQLSKNCQAVKEFVKKQKMRKV